MSATRYLLRLGAITLLTLLLPAAWGQGTPPETQDAVEASPIQPLEKPIGLDPNKVQLGEHLFHESRLSGDDTIACATCHNLALGGVDRLPHSLGIHGLLGSINAPTVFNTGTNIAQFWDGRAATLEEQAGGPVHNPVEMASDWASVVRKLQTDPAYADAFKRLYPQQGIRGESIADAIATFERSLVTVDSPFDRYLKGDDAAISDEAKEGYHLFRSYGCISCHQGRNVGGNLFQYMGVMGDYFADRGTPLTDADQGRFNVTHDEEDRHLFKVPSLRLAALTPPYFHDGSQQTLEGAIKTMGLYQLGRVIPDDDIRLIVRFIESLAGKHPTIPNKEPAP